MKQRINSVVIGVLVGCSVCGLQADINHSGTVSTIRNYSSSADPSVNESWTWFQLSGLSSISGCPSADEGAGDLAYISLPSTEAFMESMVLSAYLSGQQLDVVIEDSNYYQGMCTAKSVTFTPFEFVDPGGSILSANNPNLRLFYSMDSAVSGQITDLSQSGINGFLIGNASIGQGVLGQALSLDGDGDAVLSGDVLDDVFAGADKKFSISFWVYTNGSVTNTSVVSTTGGFAQSEDTRSVLLLIYNQKIRFNAYYANTASSYRGVESTNALPENQWAHVVITYDGSLDTFNGQDRVQIFLNGTSQTTTLNSSAGSLGDIAPSSAQLSIGAQFGSVGPLSSEFDGMLDQLRIFDKVLSNSEVDELYNE